MPNTEYAHPDGKTKRAILVCQALGCLSSHSDRIQTAIVEEIERLELSDTVDVKLTGCPGLCQEGPIVLIDPEGTFYTRVTPEDAPDIAESMLPDGQPVERLLYHDSNGQPIRNYADIPYYVKQQHIVLRNSGHINPENIEEYLAVGGYDALRKVLLGISPEQVIEEITRSGLRGRGGAGFPTGRKWAQARISDREPKFVICNADEGDPGAFMDRSILESDPHSVIEGMIIAGYAIGSDTGYIYVRAEYPLAIRRLTIALQEAKERGFLGDDILGSGFQFTLEIREGAGAFVCGEASALMYSIEGKRGMPRVKPPRSVESGLWGLPTSLNNVKSFATVPVIILRGAEWYAGIGTPNSTGTAVFALTGKVVNSGLIEVPMGMTLREIIFDIGGGILGGKQFKAVQTGGPSGGCLPASELDRPVDFDSLNEAGSIMGSGGMVVMDEDTCMVDVARYFLEFTKEESCGKCTPCRIGTGLVLEILERIAAGEGRPGDIERLEGYGETIAKCSLCGLGKSAPNPVLSTIRYFRDEYEAHIYDKRCPAGVCPALTAYYIDPAACRACTLCFQSCPVQAIDSWLRTVHIVNQEKCIKCSSCADACPSLYHAVSRVPARSIPAPPAPGTRVERRKTSRYNEPSLQEIYEQCVNCGLCLRECSFLGSLFGSRESIISDIEAAGATNKTLYSCTMCDLCQTICPSELNIGRAYLKLRQEKGPLPVQKKFIDKDQEWVLSDNFAIALTSQGSDGCQRVFFPGCHLSGHSSRLVIQTYTHLKQHLRDVGIMLGCCGAARREVGEDDLFRQTLEKVDAEMKKLGASELIVACPNCYYAFTEYERPYRIRSVYEVLAEIESPDIPGNHQHVFTIHDPCRARWEFGMQDAIRFLITRAGHQIQEMPYSRDLTLCCGQGGQIPFANMPLSKTMARSRAAQAEADIVTYCASCRDALAPEKPALHILDLLFNPEWQEALHEPAGKPSAKKESQAALRAQLLEESGG